MSLIGKNVGNYRVIAKIGEGGMGSVYLGEHPLIGKRVAIKVLHEELAGKDDIVSRFFTEAKAVNAIGHTNIVDVVDFGKMINEETGADIVYIVMEFLDGEGLNTRLKREGISINDAIKATQQCASALGASHSKNIVHRDLKPENIYLVTRGADKNFCKLLDFGIAKLTGGDAAGMSQHKTRTGLVIGTPSYMSPEQCEGKGNIDWRSDIYSLGIVLYEMLTGRVPFPGDGFGEILVAHLTKPAPLPRTIREDISPALESVVMHAIEKNKDKRFQSMDEFSSALNDVDGHLKMYGAAVAGPVGSGQATMLLDNPAPLLVPPKATGMRTVGPVTVAGSPRPTTLTGASGEAVASAGPPPRSRAPLFALAGVVVAGAVLGVYFYVEKQHQATIIPATEVPVPTNPPTPKDEYIQVSIATSPSGAKVFRAGRLEPMGTTPFDLKVKRDEPDFDVLVKLDGYKDEVKQISTQRDHDMSIALAKKETAPVPVAATADDKPEKATGKVEKERKSSHHSSGHKSSSSSSSSKKTGGKSHDADGTLEPTF